MALNLYELATSRPIERAVDSASVTLKWIALYSTDENAVATALLIVAPKLRDGLRRTKYSCTPIGAGIWMCDVEYSWSADTQTDDPDKDTDPTDDQNLGPESSFDITAGTAHITQSLETQYRWKAGVIGGTPAGDAVWYGVNLSVTGWSGASSTVTQTDGYVPAAGDVGKYLFIAGGSNGVPGWKAGKYLITAIGGGGWTITGQPGKVGTASGRWMLASNATVGSAQDVKQTIGTTRDGVEGTDIFVPKFEFTWNVQKFPVNLPYLRLLRSLVAKTNDRPWRGFAAGELIYLGGTGQSQPGNVWTIAHKFAAGENINSVPVSSNLMIPAKKAWEYAWCTYGYDTDNTKIYNVPNAVYVEKVYQSADFTLLGIGK